MPAATARRSDFLRSLYRGAARRGFRKAFQALRWTRGADVLLFFITMLAKLILFNETLNVRYMGLSFDDVVIAIGTLALAAFWTLLLPFRARIIALVALNIVLTVILYADLVYFRYFQDIISVPVLLQAGQVGALGESIATLLSPSDLLYFADWPIILAFALYAMVTGRAERTALMDRHRKRRVWMRTTAAVLVFAVGFTMVFVPISDAKRTWAKGLFGANWWNVSLYNVIGLYGFHAYDVYTFAKRQVSGRSLPPEDIEETGDWFATRGSLRQALEKDALFGAYGGRNVIMIQVEALQNFVIERTWNGQAITPHLNALLKESVYFDRFYHQTSQGRTSDADFTAHCSQQPLPSGSVFIRYADHTFDCVPSALKAEGYGTTVFHAYDGGFWNRNAMYERMAYDKFYSKKHFTLDEPLGWSLGDMSFFRQSADMITRQEQPFYSFLITLTSHHPYKLPSSKVTFDAGEFAGTEFGDYLASIHYTDAALGSFIDRLREEGLLDDTVLLLYGDHDNSIRDWSYYERMLGRELNVIERQQLLMQVPFIVRLPDGAHAGEQREDVGGQIDIAPTILHLLGIESGRLTMAGMPLLTAAPPESSRHVVFRNGSFTDGRVYYLPSAAAKSGSACFEAASGRPLQAEACEAGVHYAESELRASANAVEFNLIEAFRQR